MGGKRGSIVYGVVHEEVQRTRMKIFRKLQVIDRSLANQVDFELAQLTNRAGHSALRALSVDSRQSREDAIHEVVGPGSAADG